MGFGFALKLGYLNNGFVNMCGLAVARFDFSLGDPEYHQETLENLRAAVKATKKLCAVCIKIFRILMLLTSSLFLAHLNVVLSLVALLLYLVLYLLFDDLFLVTI